jgi:opacity protein-like surface antigen
MTLSRTTLLDAALLAALTLPATALAQDASDDWTGFYVGGSIGANAPSDETDRGVEFDTNLDGGYGDTVRTTAGADAFSPGFCGGRATSARPTTGCQDDSGGDELGARAGYDWQTGSWVFGGVLEYTSNDARDAQSFFSTTPAFYEFTRDLDDMLALRGRVGYAFGERGDWLGYLTAGYAKASIEHSFRTSNGVNSFTGSGDDEADGYQAGIGIERRVLDNFSVGLEYLFTQLEDDGYLVRVGPGTAPPTNPFLIVNPSGTDTRRTDTDFSINTVKLTASWRF